ncbi:ribonuclease H2, subunit C [Cerioporus squamosus]|nr:ribonuclease H2, subunit C [Cerioporus squamosus]
MSGTVEALTISPAHALPDATPNLMPFHIGYSGPAPISTYFRIRSSPSPTFGREARPPPKPLLSLSPEAQESSDSQATLVESVQGSSSSVTTVGSATAVDTNLATGEGDAAVGSSDSRHYVASFRGREMHGMLVDLPDGYAGIVLRAPDDKKGKGAASDSRKRDEEKPVSKGRTTRRSKRAQEEVKVEDEEMDAADILGTASEEGSTRVLEPVSTFSSFLLWNPDIPVNEGRDEYVRSLAEWTRLAAEIHRVEDC